MRYSILMGDYWGTGYPRAWAIVCLCVAIQRSVRASAHHMGWSGVCALPSAGQLSPSTARVRPPDSSTGLYRRTLLPDSDRNQEYTLARAFDHPSPRSQRELRFAEYLIPLISGP